MIVLLRLRVWVSVWVKRGTRAGASVAGGTTINTIVYVCRTACGSMHVVLRGTALGLSYVRTSVLLGCLLGRMLLGCVGRYQ